MLVVLLGCAPRLPSASLDGIELVSADLDQAEAVLRVAVDNPLPVDITIEAVRWEVEVGGQHVAGGTVDEAQALPADSVAVVSVPVTVRYADLSDTVGSGVRGAPYRVAGEVDVATWLGTWTLPLERGGNVPQLVLPTLDLVDIGFGLDGAALRLDLALKVGLPETVRLSNLGWTVTASVPGVVGPRVLARGRAEVDGSGTLALQAWVHPLDASATAARALYERRGELQFDLAGALATPLGTVPVSVSRTFVIGG